MKRKLVKRGFACVMAAAVAAGSIPAWSAEVSANTGSSEEMAQTSAQSTKIVNLETEGKENPLGVDVLNPVFSWQMTSDAIGVSQASYRVFVEKMEDGSCVWDSGTVASGESAQIKYQGTALEACTQYQWYTVVTDNFGNEITSETAVFETSLLNTSLDAWSGAEWIGADELSLDATGSTLFDISTDVQIPAGSNTASVLFGADDFRLNNKLYNLDMIEGENYFQVELDISGAGSSQGTAINVYRAGYFAGDTKDQPLFVINQANYPDTNLNALITAANKNQTHHLELKVTTSTLTLYLDNTQVILTKTDKGDSGDLILSKLGNSDAMTFPNLNSIGFAAKAGEKAVFRNFELKNPGMGTGILFGETTGATYSIWNEKEGITLSDGAITVNGGQSGILSYADPSYGSEPYLRTDFTIDKNVESARLYMGIQGIGDFYINGSEVAPEEWFKQGSMEYREEIGYNVYDVTDFLNQGENAMGAVLGEGWWTGHACTFSDGTYNYYGDKEALLVKLVIQYEDGTSKTVVSDDEEWDYCGDGPVRFASLFEGERYDASKEEKVNGFTQADFETNEEDWSQAQEIETRKPFANQDLVVRFDEEVHVIKELDAALVGETKPGSGSYIYDFGENVAAVPQIQIPAQYAKEGETITIRVAEILYPKLEEYGDLAGNLLQENYRAALTTDFYTMKAGDQTYVPDLTFHGYRYIEITGLDTPLPAENLKSLVLSSIDNTATYDSSNELVNRLFQNGQNSEASNYITLPTDCPQRNERMGWMGDANVYALAGSYNADTYQFMRQWLKCVRETQGADGMTGHVSPNYPSYDINTGLVNVGGMAFGITWNSALVFIPYYLYQQYGDTTIVEENLDAIYSYMENLEGKPLTYTRDSQSFTEPALTSNTGFLCDHLSVVSTDGAMLGNAMYVYCLKATAAMAASLGQTEKAEKYNTMYEAAKTAWNGIYIDETTGKSCKSDGSIIHTQASYASPINYGVVDESHLNKFLDNYIDTIENPVADDGSALTPYTLTTGFNATPNLLNALSGCGRADIAYKMLECTDYASWLYPVTQGATSIWERWNSYTVEDGFGGNNGMNSFNHYSLGAVTSWMMDSQLGIKYDEASPGYKHFILQPTSGGSFTYANGTFDSAYGTIYSGWKSENGKMSVYEASVPANTTATLYLQANQNQMDCMELPAGAEFKGITEHNGEKCAQIELVSGNYSFSITSASDAAAIVSQKARDEAEKARAEAEAAKNEALKAKEEADAAKKAAQEAQAKAEAAAANAKKEALQAAEQAKKEAQQKAAQAQKAQKAAEKAQKKAEQALLKIELGTVKNVLKKATSTKKKQAKVSWKKITKADGYVIQYSLKSNFKGAKTVLIKKKNTTSTTIRKLKSGRKYYFRVKAYKTLDGKKIYTKYSAKKSVQIK